MRGSGAMSNTATQRKDGTTGGPPSSDSDKMAITPNGLRRGPENTPNNAIAQDDTERIARHDGARVHTPVRTTSSFNPTTVIGALSLALLLALLGIVILLLRGR